MYYIHEPKVTNDLNETLEHMLLHDMLAETISCLG